MINRKLLIFLIAGIIIVSAGAVATVFYMKQRKNNSNTSQVENNTADDQSSSTSFGKIDPTKIPLGDGKVSTSPQKGYTYACSTNFRQGGARHAGDWLNETNGTWDSTSKVTVRGSVLWPDAQSTISVSDQERLLSTNALPKDQPTGEFPIARNDPAYEFDTNPNGITAQNLRYSIPLEPIAATSPGCTSLGPIGVMLDGVVLFNSLDDAGLDAVAHETQDTCNGHPNGKEMYHYHNMSECTVTETKDTSKLVGYALDGFGIYIERDKDGNFPTNSDLDVCHGRESEVQWNGKNQTIYHYVATVEYPYAIGCYHGTPVTTVLTGR